MVRGGEGGKTPHAKFPLSLGHMRPVSPPSSSHHHLFSSSVKNRKEGDDMSCGCDTVSFTLWPSDGREQVAATCRKRGGNNVFSRLFFRLLPVSTTTSVFWLVCFVCVSPLKLQLNTRCYCCCYKSLKPRSSQFVGPARCIFFFYKQADKGQPSPSPRSLLRPLHRQRPLPIAYVNWLLDRFALCWRGFFWMLLLWWWWWLGQMSAAMQW